MGYLNFNGSKFNHVHAFKPCILINPHYSNTQGHSMRVAFMNFYVKIKSIGENYVIS